MPARSRHCNREAKMQSMATDVLDTGKAARGDDSEARRPACSSNTVVPTGDREVLKMKAAVYEYEGPL